MQWVAGALDLLPLFSQAVLGPTDYWDRTLTLPELGLLAQVQCREMGQISPSNLPSLSMWTVKTP